MEQSIPTAHRRIAVIAVFAMVWSLVAALPAFAAPPTSSASIVSASEVLAGTQNAVYRIEVDYPSQSGLEAVLDPKNPVDVVQIVPPKGVLTDLQGQTDGWNWFRPSNSERLFFDGATLQPGDTQVFELTADVGRPHEDIARKFDVFLSDDGGASFTQSTNNGLATTIRILKITGVEVTGPTGVTDGTATTDQSNVSVDVHVANEGAPAPGGSDTITLNTTLEGAKNQMSQSGPSTYGTSTVFSFTNVTMPSSPGDITLTADSQAVEVNADAIDDLASAPLTLMRKLNLTYQSGSLAPQAVVPARVPNAPSYAFQAGFNVGGDVDATLDTASTLFQINPSDPDNTFSAALASPSGITNDGGAQTLTFQSSQVDMDDGEDYPVSVRVVGTDENDAPVDLTPGIGDGVTVDGLLPIVLPDLIGDASHLDDPDDGEEQVTTAGRTVDFGGTVEREDGTLCTACTIDDAYIQYSNGATQDVTDQITLNGGQIGGSAEVTETATNVTSATLWVTASRTRTGSGASAPLVVDNLDPVFTLATTGQVPDFYTGDYNQLRVIMVEIAESVKFDPSSLPSDWYVDNTSVQRVEAFKSDGTSTHGHADVVVLHTTSDLPENEVPQIRYEPGRGTILDGNRGADQVQRELADQIIDAVDGILPGLADLLEVNDRIQQDDTFWSNTTAPSFTLTDIDVGDVVTLYEITDGGALLRIGSGERDPNSDTVIINDNGGYTFTGVEHGDVRTVAAEVTDPSDNSSGLAEFEVNFDFVAPTVDSATQAGRDVTVTISEPLTKDPDWVGRNFASDWAAESGESWLAETYAATSVARTADDGAGFGVLTVTYEEDAASATLDRVIYEFLTDLGSGKRYEDRAGNVLADFTHDASS